LEKERGIPPFALRYWRFNGRIKADGHGNAVFPHFDAEGVCGYELRNSNFKGFASGGSKGLWLSKTGASDRRLVICESAIDALSFAVLFSDGHARYGSIGGKLNPAQPELIRAQIALMPASSQVVAAMDGDEAGRQLADAIERAFCAADRPDLTFHRQEPVEYKDWNDQLRAKPRGPLPCTRREPSLA
jgi:hypothetical protein